MKKEYCCIAVTRFYLPLVTLSTFIQKNNPSYPHIIPAVWQVKDKPHRELFITEGEKKALKLVQHGQFPIALSGVWNFQAGKNSNLDDDKSLWRDLQGFQWTGRTAYMAFDADLWTNPGVRMALWELSLKLWGMGGVIKFSQCRAIEGKGIDDFLMFRQQQGDKPDVVLDNLKASAIDMEDFVSAVHEDAIVRALSIVELRELKHDRFVRAVAKQMKVHPRILLKEIRKKQKAREIAQQQDPFTEEERQKALELLKNPDILGCFLFDCYVGDKGIFYLESSLSLNPPAWGLAWFGSLELCPLGRSQGRYDRDPAP